MKTIKSCFLILTSLLLLGNHLHADDIIQSQPEILFKFNKLKRSEQNLQDQVLFNKGVLHMQKEEYLQAIEVFKQTASYMRIPSYLNIGIAYYQLNSIYNARIYFERIYNFKGAIKTNTYAYMSSAYYLYQLSKDKAYLEEVINIAKKAGKLSEHSKRMIADTYIVLKEYEKALKILNDMDYVESLKKALLYMKLRDYEQADILLNRAKDETMSQSKIDQILWFMILRDLKANDIAKLQEHLDELDDRRNYFDVNLQLPLKMFFNKAKYTPKQYLDFLTHLNHDRSLDYMFYFAPFIFSDSKEIIYDLSKGFIFNSPTNIESLDRMIEYNADLLSLIKKDPIIRVTELKKLINEDTHSYIYYNLALAYTHIYDFHSAFKYFEKAYKSNPGNKLYAVMTLITAKKVGVKLKDYEYIENNLKSKDGLYKYFGHRLYAMFVNDKFRLKEKPKRYDRTIFYKSLEFYEKFQAKKATLKDPLIVDHYKDPLVYLMKMVLQREGEKPFHYFSRLQDSLPLRYNQNFLEGSLVITQYYVDMLKALGLFFKAEMQLEGDHSPSYLRTKALHDLHIGKPDSTVKLLENLQEIYKLEDKYTLYLIVAGLLEDGRYADASIQVSLIKAILNDNGADFLTGVQLIQDLKITSAKQYFKAPYTDTLIDFELVGFDRFLESL